MLILMPTASVGGHREFSARRAIRVNKPCSIPGESFPYPPIANPVLAKRRRPRHRRPRSVPLGPASIFPQPSPSFGCLIARICMSVVGGAAIRSCWRNRTAFTAWSHRGVRRLVPRGLRFLRGHHLLCHPADRTTTLLGTASTRARTHTHTYQRTHLHTILCLACVFVLRRGLSAWRTKRVEGE